ncbi:redoxin family protein [Massilia glaciei]|uniref:Thioredoxin family protein n=1 Tax=Massilia glaciei TaxID=1524097 RepID=A0A2U2HIS1_9BURK|nr:redoxin family protein [Massilia glaciei]PWF46658.1 thioredoxin family protein [Massilia glaciei]
MSSTIKQLVKAAVTAGFLAAASAAMANAELNKPAPAFDAVWVDGKPLNLDAYKGKTVVLEWTNHKCPFVEKHYESGNIPNLQKDAAAKGVVWLQVVSSAPGKQGHVDSETARKLNAERNAAPAATLLDSTGKIGKLYGAQTTPHIFIVDAAGQLVYKGGIDSIPTADKDDLPKAENYVAAALASIRAGKPVAKASTKPYGCSIKYAG